jgi:hypothetical protein
MIIFAKSDDFGFFYTGNEINPIVGTFENDDSVRTVATWIYRTYCDNPGPIECLFLCSHGSAGALDFGEGLTKHKATEFVKLRGAFSPNGRGVELHACFCASSTKDPDDNDNGAANPVGYGYDLLYSLAATMNTKVTGAIDYIWGFNAAYSFANVRTMTVMPNGDATFSDNIPDPVVIDFGY